MNDQRVFPEAFRITEKPSVALETVSALAALLVEMRSGLAQEVDRDQNAHAASDAAMARIATSWWEVRKHASRMLEEGASQSQGRLRRMLAVLSDVRSALSEASVEVLDEEGQEWVEGSHWEVVGGEMDESIDRAVISATLVPGVMRAGHIIQRGKVLVNHPKEG